MPKDIKAFLQYMFKGRHGAILCLLCLSVVCVMSSSGLYGGLFSVGRNGQADTVAGRPTKVYLLHADKARADEQFLPGVQILMGHIKFRHDSMYMYCDSAHVYNKTNSFEAFGTVRMEQGDTLFIYGDYLFYDGIVKLAKLRNNVKMINRNTTLMTDSLNYDRVANLGYYFDEGVLFDESNTLTSYWGEYSPETKIARFNENVELTNDSMLLTSDTLIYNTTTKIANIVGPSDIYNGDNHIYSELGYYNTGNDRAELLKRSVLSNEGKTMTGDSLFYDKRAGYGEAFRNVVMNDTVNKNILTGEYCYYDQNTEYAYATEKAVAVNYSQKDSMFMHSDTMKLVTYNLGTDSMYRDMIGYHKVSIFKSDMQGICDSIRFSSVDTCLTMFYDPVIWTSNQQILGEKIDIFLNDSTIDWAHIYNQSLAVEHVDSTFYNQVSGKEIKAYFDGAGELEKVDILGNVLAVYYLLEEDSTYIGMNYSETSVMNIYVADRQMYKLVMSPGSNGNIYPMNQRPEDKIFLPSFLWLEELRPKSKDDIFVWKGKKEEDKLKDKPQIELSLPKRDIKIEEE